MRLVLSQFPRINNELNCSKKEKLFAKHALNIQRSFQQHTDYNRLKVSECVAILSYFTFFVLFYVRQNG